MNHQECIFKKYLTSCSVNKVFADKDLTGIRKQKVIESSIQREDELYTHINDVSLAYHKLCYTAYTSKEKIERHKKRRVESNVSDPEPSKRRRLVLVFFEKNFENKQKQPLRGVLIVKVFCKLFLLIYMLENFWSKSLKNLHEEVRF